MAGTTWSNSERFSTIVIEAVAERVGIDPADLEPPLYEAVDPDALDELLGSMAGAGNDGSVTFPYRGFEVSIDADGRVDLETTVGSPEFDSDGVTSDE